MSHARLLTVLAAVAFPAAACATADSQTPENGGHLPGGSLSLSANDGGAPPPPITCAGSGATGHNPYKYAYFGDLHLHTSYSLDAFSHGTRTHPATAYEFAKGHATIAVASATTGPKGPQALTQDRPLDFLAVTDHSEYLAVTQGCAYDAQSGYYKASDCGLVRSTAPTTQEQVFKGVNHIQGNLCGGANQPACAAEQQNAWRKLWEAAVSANDPCRFTSLVGYEWTDEDKLPVPGAQPVSVNDHHNVIFGSDTVPATPFDALAYTTPPSLWNALEDWRKTSGECAADPGCDVVTIPHNSNRSAGVSLQVWDKTPEGMALQAKYQVSAEVYQAKGASECLYTPDGGDPGCSFEQLDKAPRGGASAFLRTALGNGIGRSAEEVAQGRPPLNPLELGIVGGTDNHNATAGYVDEAKYVGHAGIEDDTLLSRLRESPRYSPGALTGVWAPQNTRDEIFGAIQRRETFATSGPRITVRFYQTSKTDACTDALFPKAILDANKAVPMGGTFRAAALGTAASPTFAVAAWPDAVPQNLSDQTTAVAGLQAVQIIKVHARVGDGGTAEIVEDPPHLVSGIDAAGGCATWTDPSFTKADHAVYYVRVLQVPTYRWSHYACATLKKSHPKDWKKLVPACAPGGSLDVSIQERAWTSPIWYVPG